MGRLTLQLSIKKVLLVGLLSFGLASEALAQAALLLPNGQQQFVDGNGAPYGAGSVYFYIPNTSTPKTTWLDPNQAVANTNPVVLDAAGRATIYGTGQYTQVLKDLNGNQIWSKLTQGQDASLSLLSNLPANTLAGNSTGVAAPVQAITLGTGLSFAAGALTTHPPAANVTFTQSATGAVQTTLDSINKSRMLFATDFMTPAQIADGESRTDSIDVAGAIQACIDASILQIKNCYLSAGYWKVSSAGLTMNYNLNLSNGNFLVGDGAATLIDFRANTASGRLLIVATGGSVGTPASSVYGGLIGLSIQCNFAGPCVQVGQADFSDAMNQESFINVSVQNFNTSGSSICYQFNAVYSANAFSVNCASGAGPTGGNDLFQFRKVSFGHWNIGGSNGQTFIHMTTDVNTGNVFSAVDCEVVKQCWVIDSASSVDNVAVGGTWSWNWGSTGASGVIESAGGNNAIIYPNKSPNTTVGAAGTFIQAGSEPYFKLWNTSTIAPLIDPVFPSAATVSGAFTANGTVHFGALNTGTVAYAVCLEAGGKLIIKGSNCF